MRSTALLPKSCRALRRVVMPALALGLLAPTVALAQNDTMTPIAIPAQPDAITLDTGALPGATATESWHSQYGSVFARNVTVATLTPFLPDPAKANGTAVVVTPGGGFRTLSMENEGWDVARALAAKGVAAFVLDGFAFTAESRVGQAIGQNSRAALTRAMKKAVLDGIDTAALPGKTIEVVGAFRLINPKNWLITPVKVTVK